MHEIPELGRPGAVAADGRSASSSRSTCTSSRRRRRRGSPSAQSGLYRFLLNKWYFDELYDFLFVRPAFWLGRLFWKGGDGAIIDRLGPDGVAARVHRRHQRDRQAADRLRLSLRLRHADRRRRVHHLVSGRRGALMFGFGILSALTFLPLVGAALILLVPRRRRSGQEQRPLDRAVDDARRPSLSRSTPGASSIPASPASSSSSRRAGSARASPTSWASTACRCPSSC